MANDFPPEGKAPMLDVIRSFKNELQFIEWCCMGSIGDLEVVINELLEAEMYYHCSIVNMVIKGMQRLN